MKKRPSPLLDDMTRMAKGAASAMDDVRGDMQSRWRRRNPSAMAQAMKENMPPRASRAMERMAGGLAERMGRNQAAQSAPAPAQDSVSREEFEAALARIAALAERIKQLESAADKPKPKAKAKAARPAQKKATKKAKPKT